MIELETVLVAFKADTSNLDRALKDVGSKVEKVSEADLDKQLRSLNQKTQTVQNKIDTIDKSAGEKVRVTELQSALNELERDGKKLGSGQRKILESDLDKLKETVDKLDELTKKSKEAAAQAKALGKALQDAFVDAVFESKKLGDVLEALGKKILKIALFGGEGGGGLLGGILKKIGKSVGAAFIGGKAGGGAVQPATPVLVGERGPEIFVPKTVGSIVPNGALGGVGGGQPVVVNQTIRFDVGLESVDSRIRQSAPVIAASAVAAIREQNTRDPFG